MNMKKTAQFFCLFVFIVVQRIEAAGLDTQRIHGYDAQSLLGSGTGVVMGIIDSGIDVNHPALSGTVSSGQPRLVAEANFVTSEPSNTGDDVFGHGTAVAGQILSRDASHQGVATDARYINARVLDSTNSFGSDAPVVNGTGYALSNGANMLNMSLGYFGGFTTGDSKLGRMADYIAYAFRVPITVSAGNAGNSSNHLVQGPADAFNVIALGSTSAGSNWSQIVSDSSYGPTSDLRDKPDIAAPGNGIVTAQEHTTGFSTWSGTSFAAPNAAGILAAAYGYGLTHGISTDPLVLKATLLNTAEKIRDRSGIAWAPSSASTIGGVYTVTSPLNASAGAGQVDGLRFANEYLAGQHAPGDVSALGWDLNNVGSTTLDYHLGQLQAGSTLETTLDWFRHIGWNDADQNGMINSADSFTFDPFNPLTNLDLFVYRNNVLIAKSSSLYDNVEQLTLTNLLAGDYDIRVTRISGNVEQFGLAWSAVAVPEPATIVSALLGVIFVLAASPRKPSRIHV